MTQSKRNGGGHATETPDVSHVRNIDVTREMSDVNIGAILTFVVVLTVLAIVIQVGLWLLYKYFNRQAQAEPKPGPMAMSKEERLPPEPRLQGAPGFGVKLESGQIVKLENKGPQAEYQVVRSEWEKALTEGSKDQSGRPIGLPIDEAIKKVVQENLLKSRSQTVPGGVSQDHEIEMPTAASSGRVSEKRR